MATQKQHRAIDPEVCPKCGSDATSAIVQIDDEVEGTVCCAACGVHYEVVRENGLKYVYWTDDEGEHFIYDDDYLVRLAAQRLRDAAAEAEEVFTQIGELGCFTQMGPECWAAIESLREALAEAKGEGADDEA